MPKNLLILEYKISSKEALKLKSKLKSFDAFIYTRDKGISRLLSVMDVPHILYICESMNKLMRIANLHHLTNKSHLVSCVVCIETAAGFESFIKKESSFKVSPKTVYMLSAFTSYRTFKLDLYSNFGVFSIISAVNKFNIDINENYSDVKSNCLLTNIKTLACIQHLDIEVETGE